MKKWINRRALLTFPCIFCLSSGFLPLILANSTDDCPLYQRLHRDLFNESRTGVALLAYYELTGDRRYVNYAEFLYRDYSGSSDTGPCDIKLPVLLDPDAAFMGHGAHVAEQFRVPFFLACATGAESYRQASRAVFTKLARHVTPSGAMVSDKGIHNQPPLPGQGYEYCATTELATSLISALQKFGKMDYADQIEWLVFNAAQGARTPDGRKIAYISAATLTRALEQMRLGYPHNSNGRWHYSVSLPSRSGTTIKK